MLAITVFLSIAGLVALIIYLRYLVDKKIHLKVVCPVCSGIYKSAQFIKSEISKENICMKCKLAEELNRREIGE